MITITYNPDKHYLRIKGHAGTAPKGQDIVCAAVSFGFFNLAQMLSQYDEGAFSLPLTLKNASKGGVASIKCTPTAEYETLIDHDFMYALVGFNLLASNYPDAVNLVVTSH